MLIEILDQISVMACLLIFEVLGYILCLLLYFFSLQFTLS